MNWLLPHIQPKQGLYLFACLMLAVCSACNKERVARPERHQVGFENQLNQDIVVRCYPKKPIIFGSKTLAPNHLIWFEGDLQPGDTLFEMGLTNNGNTIYRSNSFRIALGSQQLLLDEWQNTHFLPCDLLGQAFDSITVALSETGQVLRFSPGFTVAASFNPFINCETGWQRGLDNLRMPQLTHHFVISNLLIEP